MAYIYDLADTWNASGTVFTGIKLNVTDTASAAGSLLMDLQVGGVSQFSVNRTGGLRSQNLDFRPDGNSKPSILPSITHLTIRTSEFVSQVNINSSGMHLGTSTGFLSWNGGYGNSGGGDTQLHRDAANTLAQRNGVNAQAFNIYNTYTDASNYERLEVKWLSNIATIESIAAGTGTRRALRLKSGGGSLDITNFTVTSNLNLEMASNYITGPAYIQFTEQTAPAAPATNNVRIYAEDDGAGKTRLMARFATGAAVQIAVEP